MNITYNIFPCSSVFAGIWIYNPRCNRRCGNVLLCCVCWKPYLVRSRWDVRGLWPLPRDGPISPKVISERCSFLAYSEGKQSKKWHFQNASRSSVTLLIFNYSFVFQDTWKQLIQLLKTSWLPPSFYVLKWNGKPIQHFVSFWLWGKVI